MYRVLFPNCGEIWEIEEDVFKTRSDFYYHSILSNLKWFWYHFPEHRADYHKAYIERDGYLVSVLYYRPGFIAWHCFNADGDINICNLIDKERFYNE